MPALKIYDIFISHAWSYDSDYYRVVQLLDGASNFRWRNYSVPTHDPVDANSTTKLKEALRRQMRPANAVLILSGMYATYSEWIEFEIDFAIQLGKPIVGIRPWGQQQVPKIVTDAATVMVGWNSGSIVGAIRQHSL